MQGNQQNDPPKSESELVAELLKESLRISDFELDLESAAKLDSVLESGRLSVPGYPENEPRLSAGFGEPSAISFCRTSRTCIKSLISFTISTNSSENSVLGLFILDLLGELSIVLCVLQCYIVITLSVDKQNF